MTCKSVMALLSPYQQNYFPDNVTGIQIQVSSRCIQNVCDYFVLRMSLINSL